MGNTCKPMAVSFQCMTKSTTNLKKKKKKRLSMDTSILTENIAMEIQGVSMLWKNSTNIQQWNQV